ncbi:aminotransferase [Truncatella angustata]|uniref:Aminotransferase n=1 Tax=Truncatella angustata TaxID=152316 RepID=A0A9P8UIW2_9PEZI|nr:aminotransferase [Truncatella angustata]KAH6652972.1 aminotransferase [Truncatella angustata]KAH8195317.1 hypothetical protein TruAng_010510 [Truncatella angustata]
MVNFELFTSIRYDPVLLEAQSLKSLSINDWNRRTASPWYMLDYHRDRMLRAATHFGWERAIAKIEGPEGLNALEHFLSRVTQEAGLRPHRVKILLYEDGKLDLQYSPIPQKNLGALFPSHLPALGSDTNDSVDTGNSQESTPPRELTYDILIDSDATSPSEFTHYKTTSREMYDDARRRHQLSLTDLKEVLLVNSNDGSIMEGSFTTPYFWRNGRWVTPPVSKEFREGRGSGGNDGTSRRWALERGIAVEETVHADSLQNDEQVWLSTGVRGFVFGRIKR